MSDVDDLDRLRPTEGARFLLQLERIEPGERAARYRGWILTPEASHAYQVDLTDDAAVVVGALGDAGAPAADELTAMLTTIAKLTARAAAGKRADGLPPWPHRVLRWRGAGR